jgi:hypothetical protein|eukprot:COSAG01_NODE_1259_length_11009_cov_53.138930_11_plen_78_part_00
MHLSTHYGKSAGQPHYGIQIPAGRCTLAGGQPFTLVQAGGGAAISRGEEAIRCAHGFILMTCVKSVMASAALQPVLR